MTKITQQRLSELNCSTITDREIRKLVKAYRKAKYGDEWIEWGGGLTAPLPAGTLVKVRHRSGEEFISKVHEDYASNWSHYDTGGDIIAYRVVNK